MKTLIKSGLAVVITLLAFSSCKKDNHQLDMSVTPVSTLNGPSDNMDIKIDPKNGANIVFQWQASPVAVGDLVLYEVAFDKAGGDFSKPVYKVVSDGSGVQAQATITQKDLNKIASLAGIASSSTGQLKWAVLTSKATNTKISSTTRTLSLERPAGFATLPTSLYITGTATENGDDVTKAIPLKKTSDGVFEIYTSLKAGSYQLVDQQSASGTKYYIDANNVIQQGTVSTITTGAAQAYRLNYDFTDASTQSTQIDSIGLFVSAYDTEQGELKYTGNGTWESPLLPIVFYQFSWGRDDRYKYVLHTPGGTTFYGSENENNNPPAGQPVDYFYLLPVTNDQWNYTYKFDPAADNHKIKVDVYFQASGPYTQKITYNQ